ncbi:MAG TPA: DUF2066 domain-containing protein [Hyphomicrobiales bacterium]|nr:DUF2066 domain-containing protein [Hyphomicrobiales bacterium]
MSFAIRFLACLLIAGRAILPASAQETEADLYKAETIVTGTVEPERSRGFAAGALQVLVKLTGQLDLVGTSGAAALQKQAPELVTEFSYEDRMKDIPVHDEQGTRERPYFLRIRFDRQKFDHALAIAGFEKWIGKRPVVAVWLGIRDARSEYILSRDGEGGYSQRLVLDEASKLRAIPIILPDDAQTAVTFADIEKGNRQTIEAVSLEHGADAVLYGLLEFDGNAYWNCRWSAYGEDVDVQWSLTGVTFDRALKDRIDQVMSVYAARARQQ